MTHIKDPTSNTWQLVIFRLQDREFALPMAQVAEVLRMVALTPMPDAPAWFAGVINLRGQVIAIMDLRTRLGLAPRPPRLDTRIVVVESDGATLGLVVDAVSDVRVIPGECVERPDWSVETSNLLTSVARIDGRLVTILGLDGLMATAHGFENTQTVISTSGFYEDPGTARQGRWESPQIAREISRLAIEATRHKPPFEMTDDQDDSAVQSILAERARGLAIASKAETVVEDMAVVVLRVGKEIYGVEMRFVNAVRPLDNVTLLPGTPAFYAGLVNLRGRIYPVLDLRRYLGLAESGVVEKGKLVLVAAAGLTLCLRVDDVLGVRRIVLSEIEPLLEGASDRRGVVTGVTPDLLSMLDLNALLADPALIVKQESI